MTPTEKRAVAKDLVTARVKPKRACFLVGLPKSTWHYQPKRRQDSELRQRLRELALRHPRRGYRFIHALLVQEGHRLNRKKVRRLWREEALTVKAKPGRKLRTGASIPMQAEFPGHVWTYDFIFDQTLGGTTLKILSLTDEFTRQSLALRARESFTSRDVKDVLHEVIAQRGAPGFIRSDNGPEFIARDLAIWLAVQDIGTRFIQPGKPWQNGFAELSLPAPGGVPEPGSVLLGQARPGRPGRLQNVPQRQQATFVAGLSHPRRVCPAGQGTGCRPPLRERRRRAVRHPLPWVSQEVPCCTLLLSRVSTRNCPNFGARPPPGAGRQSGE